MCFSSNFKPKVQGIVSYFLEDWQLAHSFYSNAVGNTNVLQNKIIQDFFLWSINVGTNSATNASVTARSSITVAPTFLLFLHPCTCVPVHWELLHTCSVWVCVQDRSITYTNAALMHMACNHSCLSVAPKPVPLHIWCCFWYDEKWLEMKCSQFWCVALAILLILSSHSTPAKTKKNHVNVW